MKRYQAVAFLLSTAMTVSSVAPVFGASNDVFGHWAELTITKWQNEGRIGGYEDGTFKPDKAITRAEFVRLLNSAAPTAFTSSTSINFSDVKESDWFYADVAKAVGGRVASGFEDGTFRPGETVTRMQAAVFICNAKGLTPNEAAANNFTDAASIPSWAKGAVGAAVAAGYLSGYPDGSFGGSKGMTRAEAVSTLDRVLGGGSTTSTPSGEIDTSDRDKDAEKEDNRTAEAGNMVWTSGGSGGGSSKKSSSSSSSSSSDKKTNNVTIRSQKDADDYEGKTLTGTTEIYVDGSGIDLQDIKFKGDVEIYADDTVAAAYIGKDTAVAAASSTVDIYFEGKTNVTGKITVIRNNVAGADQVVIRTRTPRALSASVLAKVATKIVGFEINRVEAQAPVEIAEGAKVNTVEAGDNATVEVAADASVDKVNVTGDAKDIVLNGEGSTDVTVKSGASVDQIVVDSTEATVELEGSAKVNDVFVVGNATAAVKVNDNAKVDNVAVSDSASADVAVADKAAVNKVELSDTATAKVDVAPDAKVDTITSTSTGKTEVSGEGTVDKIEATDPSTVDTSNAGDNVANVDKKEEENTTPATTTITAAQLKGVKLAAPVADQAASVTGLPTGVKQSGTNWTAESTATPTADDTGSGDTGSGDTGSGDTGSGDTGSGDTGTTTPTTKKHTATITLTADTGYAFDTTIKTADLTGLADAIEGEATVTATEIKFNVTADIAATDPDNPDNPDNPEDPVATGIKITTPNNDTTILQGGTLQFTATLTGGTGFTETDTTDVEWKAVDANEKEYTIENGLLDLSKEDTQPADKTTITITATSTKDKDTNGDFLVGTTTITVEAAANDATKLAALAAVESAMTDASKTVSMTLTEGKTQAAVESKIAEEAKKALSGTEYASWTVIFAYDTTNGAFSPLTTETTEVKGKFSVKQTSTSEATDGKEVKTVKVAVAAEEITEGVTFTLDKPTVDGTPATSAAAASSANYAVEGNVVWKTKKDGDTDTFSGDAPVKFAKGGEYQATVTLKANTGYKFANNAKLGTDIVAEADGSAKVGSVSTEKEQNTMTVVVTYKALSDGNENTPAITSLKGKLTDDTEGTAGNAITVTKGDTAQTINLTLVTEHFADTGDGVVLEIAPSSQSTLSANTGFMNNDALDSANKVSKTIDAATLNGAATQSLKVQVGADQTGSFTITAKIGESGDVAATATVTVTVNNGGGSGGTEITTVDALTVTVPAGATEVPEESTSLTVASGKGYTATLDWADASNEGKWVEGSNNKNYFKAGETYTATITLAPDGQNTFKGIDKVSVIVGNETAKDVTLSADTDNNKALTGTVDVTIAEGTATVAPDGEGISGTKSGAVTGTVTITLTGDAFNTIAEDADLSTYFKFTNLPDSLTPKVNAAVTEGAKTATIKFDGNLAADATTVSNITVEVLKGALISGTQNGISSSGNFTITVTEATE